MQIRNSLAFAIIVILAGLNLPVRHSVFAVDHDGPVVTKIYIVRHAERNKGYNPPLNKEGKKRAADLKETLIDSGITAIYYPDWKRNHQTALPLLKATGIKPIRLDRDLLNDTEQFAKDLAERIYNEALGETILYIGNQKGAGNQMGNIQELYYTLGGEETPLTRYFDMYILIMHDKKIVNVHHTLYGDVSEDFKR